MALSFPDFEANDGWQDVAIQPGYAGVANQQVTIQNKGVRRALVYFGGAVAPTGAGFGAKLAIDGSVTGTSDHIWVKGGGPIAVLVED